MESTRRTGTRGEHQLPAGPHGLSRAFVAHNQRERLMAALGEATAAAGYAQTSVEDIIARAGVSRRTFYDLFKNKEDAFVATYDEVVRLLLSGVRSAMSEGPDFAQRVTGGMRAFLESLAASPSFAQMCIVEVLAAGPEAVRRRNEAMAAFAALIEDEARTSLESRPQSPIAAEMIVGGVYETVYSRIAARRIDELERLLPELVYAALLPYVGEHEAASARRELVDAAGAGPESPAPATAGSSGT